jgi:hypothetical protein
VIAVDADKLRAKLVKLFGLLGSENENEREAARVKIKELLAKNKKTWNDLTDLLATGNPQGWQDDEPEPEAPQTETPHPLDLIACLLEKFLHLTDAQRIATTLWIAHTFIFGRFSVTPRLAVLSPVRGCGKTTALNLVKALGFNVTKIDHVTSAVLFRIIDRDRACVLLDEGDNQDLPINSILRAVLNSGHHSEGRISRYLDGEVVTFTTFGPLALAAIGRLPLPMLHRSIVIRMERAPKAELERFDPKTKPEQQRMCDAVYRETLAWAQQPQFDADPPVPKDLRNRSSDSWRGLLAIADAGGPEWAKVARDAAIELSSGHDEDLGVELLHDIREIFDRHLLDRIGSTRLARELVDLPDGKWSEWRGVKDDGTPRKLTPGGLAQMLVPFGIRPKTIWPPRRGVQEKSIKGYRREQFEQAWACYCGEPGTPSHASNVRYLHGQ